MQIIQYVYSLKERATEETAHNVFDEVEQMDGRMYFMRNN